ncbi:MAG: hypothetical protein H6718_32870 [Polyangiaceae bacterium]|nr:hypothetical protein [Myxococcales bacterium]MCB9590251.1 hypothetical protein [Polyangiaceae bacterium]
MSLRTWLALIGAGALACGIAACGSDERINDSQSAGAGGDAGAGAAGAGGNGAQGGNAGSGGTPAVRRSVEYRSPYGNMAESDNLLWDGDFEWHSAFASQYGWVTPSIFGRFQPTTLDNISVGPQCKSGLKCAPLGRTATILGVGVSPTGASVEASVWAKPVSGNCAEVEAALIGCFDGGDPEEALTPATAPDEKGWCEYRGVFPERQRATCLSVTSLQSDNSVTLVDDAVLKAAPANARIIPSQTRISARLKAAAPKWQAGMREWIRPGMKPPTPAGQALEAWLTRRKVAQMSNGGVKL